jgi:hypothetical protein
LVCWTLSQAGQVGDVVLQAAVGTALADELTVGDAQVAAVEDAGVDKALIIASGVAELSVVAMTILLARAVALDVMVAVPRVADVTAWSSVSGIRSK